MEPTRHRSVGVGFFWTGLTTTGTDRSQMGASFSFRSGPALWGAGRCCGEAGLTREEHEGCTQVSSIYYLNLLYSIKTRTKTKRKGKKKTTIYAQSVYSWSCIHNWSSIKIKLWFLPYKTFGLLQVSWRMDFYYGFFFSEISCFNSISSPPSCTLKTDSESLVQCLC